MRIRGLEGEHRLMPDWATHLAVLGLAHLLLHRHGPAGAIARAKHLEDSASKAKKRAAGPTPRLARTVQEIVSETVYDCVCSDFHGHNGVCRHHNRERGYTGPISDGKGRLFQATD